MKAVAFWKSLNYHVSIISREGKSYFTWNAPLIEPYTIYVPDITFEQLLEFSNEDISCELINGVLIIHSPASYIHESIFSFLMAILKIFGKKYELGIPIGSRFVMKLSEKWAPEPDILFLTPKDQENLKETYLEGPASVVFEILSKSNNDKDLNEKLPKYLEKGVKEVWIIDPENKIVDIHWKNETESATGDNWIASRIIQNFKIKVSWLWDSQKLDILKILDDIG